MLTLKQARKLFRYAKSSGKLYWKVDIGKVKAGDEVGCVFRTRTTCYRKCRVYGMYAYVHRIVWLVNYGRWPDYQIGHDDHNGLNNRLSNLKDVTNKANSRNKPLQKNNTTGYHGVERARSGRWLARVSVGKAAYLGTYDEKRDAIKAAAAARKRLGFHPNHGQPRRAA